MQNFIDSLIGLVKGLMAPAMTAAAVVVFTIMSLNGTLDIDKVWWIILGVFAFWMGDRFINKYIAPPKANGQVVTPSTPVVSSDGTVFPSGETNADTSVTQIEPIIFDPVSFKQDVESTVAGDYAGINTPTTQFYEARDKVVYRWIDAGKINNNVATKDLRSTILDYAKKSMAFIWAGVLGQTPSEEFNSNPIKYVNDHFADFRNCPSCKQPVANQLVDIKWLALALTEGTYTSYLDLLNSQDAYNNTVDDLRDNGVQSWAV